MPWAKLSGRRDDGFLAASWHNETQDFAQQPYHLASVGSRLPDGYALAWSIVDSMAVLEAGAPSTLEPEGAMSEGASPTDGHRGTFSVRGICRPWEMPSPTSLLLTRAC